MDSHDYRFECRGMRGKMSFLKYAIVLPVLAMLSSSTQYPALAQTTTVEVTIQVVKPDAKEITVTYKTSFGEKSTTLDVSRKAEITLNGEASSLEALGAGQKATVEYDQQREIVTKLVATTADRFDELFHSGLFPRSADTARESDWQIETQLPRDSLSSVDWSPAGDRLACAELSGIVRIYDTKSWHLVNVLSGYLRGPGKVAWSPDGKRVAAIGGKANVLRIWTADGKPETAINMGGRAVPTIAWSPDSRKIASTFAYREIAVYSLDGTQLLQLKGHRDTVTAVVWSPDGKQIASASRDGVLRLWQPSAAYAKQEWPDEREQCPDERGKLFVPSITLEGHQDRVDSLAWNPESTLLASGDDAGKIRLWRSDGTTKTRFNQERAVHDLVWSPDGKRLASTFGKRVTLWNSDGKHEQTLSAAAYDLQQLSWSPDGERLAAVVQRSKIQVWNLDGTSEEEISGYPTSEASTRRVLWSPNGKIFTSASRDTAIRIWNADGSIGDTWFPPGKDLRYARVSPNGKWFATISLDDQSLRFWKLDGTTGPQLNVFPDATLLAIDRLGQRVAVGGMDGSIRLANRLGESEATMKTTGRHIIGLSWSPDGRHLASNALIDDETTVRLWTAHGKAGPVLEGHNGRVTAFAWHPNSHKLATIDVKGNVRMWDAGGSLIARLHQHYNSGGDVAWSPDGRWLASSSTDIRFWKEDGTPGKVIEPGINSIIGRLAWNSDGTWLAAQFYRQSIGLWKPSGEAGPMLHGENLSPGSASWSPDGRQIACPTIDDTWVVWDTASGETEWVGLALREGKTATVTAQGELISDDETLFDKQFVFVQRDKAGKNVLRTADEFRRSVEQNRDTARSQE